MSTNEEVASILTGIADLLDLQGEKFKPEAYRRAARSILGAGEDLRSLRKNELLGEIPGVGDAIRKKIEEFLDTGRIDYYGRLQKETPPGVIALMRLPGVGPKTASRFHRELGIDSPDALLQAIERGRLSGISGFGEKKIRNLRQAVGKAAASSGERISLRSAWRIATSLVETLARSSPIGQIEIAGSLRRRRESIGDIDILATSESPTKVIETFAKLPGVREVVLQGDTKCTVQYEPGIQVDLRVLAPESFGAAWQYFTGSKDHNIRIRTWAKDRGLRVNEYGVYRNEELVAGRTEEDVYASLGLPWMPPEIRENQGELDEALLGRVPPLVALSDLKGELHQHLSEESELKDLPEIARQASQRSFEYVGVVIGGSAGGSPRADRLSRIREAWPEPRASPSPRLLIGWEVPLDRLVELSDLPAGIDYLVGIPSAESGARTPAPSTRVPKTLLWFVGHLKLAQRPADPAGETAAGWVGWAKGSGIALEVTPDGPVDGLDALSIRRAVESGISLVVSAGSTHPGEFGDLELSTGLARRGWAPPQKVLNAIAELGAAPVREPGNRTATRQSAGDTGTAGR